MCVAAGVRSRETAAVEEDNGGDGVYARINTRRWAFDPSFATATAAGRIERKPPCRASVTDKSPKLYSARIKSADKSDVALAAGIRASAESPQKTKKKKKREEAVAR